MGRALAVALALTPGLALGKPPGAAPPASRYGEAVAVAPRSGLARRVEQVALGLLQGRARSEEIAAATASVDARLEAALDRLIVELPASGPPSGGLFEQALWLGGIVEPVPYLLTISVPAGAEADVEGKLGPVLAEVVARGRYRRVAAATAPLGPGGGQRVALALQETFVELAPVPRALPAHGRATLEGRVLPPYHAPSLFVTAPDGSVSRIGSAAAAADPTRVSGTFVCQARRGAYQIEVAAEDRFGDAVLANFPVHCGVPAPRAIRARPGRPAAADDASAEARSFVGRAAPEVAAAVESRVLELLQRDRAAAGLPPLAADPRLSAVARAHSAQMRDDHFFGHLSPTTGSALDRLTRAGVTVVRVRENVARALSAAELERGLMGSPSHRANILATDVDRAGIGVAAAVVDAAAGTHDLYLTQLFAKLPTPFDVASATAALRARVQALRRAAGLAEAAADPLLDGLAAEVAAGLADGSLDGRGKPDGGPVERAEAALEGRYRFVRRVSGKAVDVSQFAADPALLGQGVTHAGVAVAAGKAEAGGDAPLWLVVLLGARR